MRRALMGLNLYGREAARHKLKNGLKTQKMHFLPVFEHMSDSLTTILVEPHQCSSHQFILFTQRPIPEILSENIENWRLFGSVILDFFFCFIPMIISQNL